MTKLNQAGLETANAYWKKSGYRVFTDKRVAKVIQNYLENVKHPVGSVTVQIGYRKCKECYKPREYGVKRGWWIFSDYDWYCKEHVPEAE